ncbi:MAG: hypothetical protein E6G45_00585 [Actinobacteria bacterium]|nr:MAG: hypothetical protein E6G45_00585 [Actinomycetota bacterium]
MKKILPARRTLVALAATASVLAALVGAGAAPGDVVTPVVSLGPTTVANGVATVSGTVTAPAPSNAQLSINGQPVGLNADGTFAGIVNLNGQSTLSLAVRNPATGEVSTTNVPLTTNLVGPGGVVSPTVLSDLEQAAATITKPLGGFVSIGGQPISVSGGVGNRDGLASLSVNGIDALSLLHPNGTFSIPIPGTSKEVSVMMTDKQGVSVETRYPAVSAAYVTAANAVGVRIASIRYYTKRIKATKRLRMIVTVKDRRGVLVRGAKVTVRSARSGSVIGHTGVKSSNKKGQAGFFMRLRPKAFGKRFVVVATAKTPRATASKRSSVRLPRLAKHK